MTATAVGRVWCLLANIVCSRLRLRQHWRLYLFGVLMGVGVQAVAWGFEYPVRTLRITSLFGEARGDHFHSGVDFAIRQAIFPVAAGEVLFVHDQRDPRTMPAGTGNTVIIEHDNNLRSYYYHLEATSIPPAMTQVTPQTSIGIVGNSGYSLGAHLHVEIEELEQMQMLNPLMLLPPFPDTVKPQLASFFFKINDKLYSLKKRRAQLRYLGPVGIYVVAFDYISQATQTLRKKFGLRRLTLRIDGKLFRDYEFDYFKKTAAGLKLKSGETFEEVFGLPFNYKLGTFIPSRGEHVFELRAEDWARNVQTLSYRVTFRN